MNMEEARKVIWVRTNPRPLGELLDEGLLTKKDLEWAAEWAYNPKLKVAAKIILESENNSGTEKPVEQMHVVDTEEIDTGVEIGISLERARATHWPFMPYKGQPMGRLLESKQISLKDLGFAIEKAWDEKVKQAAIALTLVRLRQVVKEPASPAGFVHVVSGGRSFAQKRETLFTLLQGALFGVTLAFMLYFLFPSLRGAGKPNPDAISFSEFISRPNGILSFAIGVGILIFFGWLFNFVFERINKKIEDQIEAYQLGQEGEDNVTQLIVQALDGNRHLFRNISLPGRNKGDLETV